MRPELEPFTGVSLSDDGRQHEPEQLFYDLESHVPRDSSAARDRRGFLICYTQNLANGTHSALSARPICTLFAPARHRFELSASEGTRGVADLRHVFSRRKA